MSSETKHDRLYHCYVCDIPFAKEYTLKRHLSKKICERSILDINNKKDILKCQYCSKSFESKSKIERHLSNIKGKCFKLRHGNSIKEKRVYNIQNVDNRQIYNTNIQNIQQQNNTFIQIQPIIKEKVVLAKHGEETISHITKEVMLKILDIESFPEMCTELMRLLYFNKEVPENRNWTIVYPKNKNAGVEYNHETKRFERKKTYNIIDDKFSNMVNLLFDLVQEISNEDILNNNLSKRQKININKYGMHFGQWDISKTSKEVYNSIHEFAYNSRIEQMKEWGDSGHQGNHLSLKFK
jgi:Zinc finger, C2H2 type